ncbi:MAG: hypothetical protein RLZZ304_344 [Actinomycetota bacterium]
MDNGAAAVGLLVLYVFLSVLGFILAVLIWRWIFRVNEMLAELRVISSQAVYQGEMLNYISEQIASQKDASKQ